MSADPPATPGARVVYTDIDPMVSTHAAALMAGADVVTLRADLREPEQVLGGARVRDLLDFGQPVGIMFMCVLHCLWDKEDPVAPALWRPDLDNPLSERREHGGGDVPVLRLIVPGPAEPDRGVAWHLCGIGVKD